MDSQYRSQDNRFKQDHRPWGVGQQIGCNPLCWIRFPRQQTRHSNKIWHFCYGTVSKHMRQLWKTELAASQTLTHTTMLDGSQANLRWQTCQWAWWPSRATTESPQLHQTAASQSSILPYLSCRRFLAWETKAVACSFAGSRTNPLPTPQAWKPPLFKYTLLSWLRYFRALTGPNDDEMMNNLLAPLRRLFLYRTPAFLFILIWFVIE